MDRNRMPAHVGKHRPPTDGALRDREGRTWQAVSGGSFWMPSDRGNEPSTFITFTKLSDAHGPLIRQEADSV